MNDITLFIYPDGVDGPMEQKRAEVEAYIADFEMEDLVVVAYDSYKDTIAVTGPDDLLFELYSDIVYTGDDEGLMEGFEASIG